VACPKLGCGEGGLAWSDVRPLLIERFAAVPEVEWMVFGEAG
jgi:hypothetical protein